MYKIKGTAISLIVVVIMILGVACNQSEEEWVPVNEDETKESLVRFMEDYKEKWEESLIAGTFSPVEPYFIANSQVYHMERRQHQQISSRREVEQFMGYDNLVIQENNHEEYRFTWQESIMLTGTNEDIQIIRERSYTIAERKEGSYRIISVEREDN